VHRAQVVVEGFDLAPVHVLRQQAQHGLVTQRSLPLVCANTCVSCRVRWCVLRVSCCVCRVSCGAIYVYLEDPFLEAEFKNADGEHRRREEEQMCGQRHRGAAKARRRPSHVQEYQVERDYETLQQVVLDLALECVHRTISQNAHAHARTRTRTQDELRT
jgi:hypothetical protein